MAFFEEKYKSAIDAINARSNIHLAQVRPTLEKPGISEGADYSFKQIREAFGGRIYITMQQATDQVSDHIDETFQYI